MHPDDRAALGEWVAAKMDRENLQKTSSSVNAKKTTALPLISIAFSSRAGTLDREQTTSNL